MPTIHRAFGPRKLVRVQHSSAPLLLKGRSTIRRYAARIEHGQDHSASRRYQKEHHHLWIESAVKTRKPMSSAPRDFQQNNSVRAALYERTPFSTPSLPAIIANMVHTRRSQREEDERGNNVDVVDEGIKAVDDASDHHNSDPDVHEFEVPSIGKIVKCNQRGGAPNTHPALVFTHGAASGIDDPATADFAKGFASVSSIVCFQGNMNMTSRLKYFNAVIEHVQSPATLGGRSMGARAATMIAHENADTKTLVLVSYPLIGDKGDVRDQILLDVPEHIEVLFIIGNADEMCPGDQFSEVRSKMKAKSWLAVVEGANHNMSLRPKKAIEPLRRATGALAAKWLLSRSAHKRNCTVMWDAEKDEIVTGNWS